MTMATSSILRGQVYWVELDPVRGAEIAKTRPCIVLSTDEVNNYRRTAIVVPLTTSASPAVPPLLLSTPSMGTDSKARIEHIRAVDKSRFKALIGEIGVEDLSAVEESLRRILRLPKQ
jgi:mRNA interferase MazF